MRASAAACCRSQKATLSPRASPGRPVPRATSSFFSGLRRSRTNVRFGPHFLFLWSPGASPAVRRTNVRLLYTIFRVKFEHMFNAAYQTAFMDSNYFWSGAPPPPHNPTHPAPPKPEQSMHLARIHIAGHALRFLPSLHHPRPHTGIPSSLPCSPPTTKRVHDGLSCVGTGIMCGCGCACVSVHTRASGLFPPLPP